MTALPDPNVGKVHTGRAAKQFAGLFEDCEDFLGPAGVRRVWSTLSTVPLAGHRTTEELTSLLVLADLADRAEVFFGGLEVLRAVPWNGDSAGYEPVRQLFCGALRRAERTDLDPAPYETMISLPETGAAGPPAPIPEIRSRASGSMLARLRTSAAKAEAARPHHHFAAICNEVRELYLMWAFGGSLRWSRNTIDIEIDAAATKLHQIGVLT